ncbi:MAG TPA: hypothetical protein VN843_25925, partial [Anaerolineales bacterium]|nr:hypothetical protein [Anaerolineales bacterium]
GGTSRFYGPLVGAILFVLLPEVLRLLLIPDSIAANMRLIIQGFIVLALLRYRPGYLKDVEVGYL